VHFCEQFSVFELKPVALDLIFVALLSSSWLCWVAARTCRVWHVFQWRHGSEWRKRYCVARQRRRWNSGIKATDAAGCHGNSDVHTTVVMPTTDYQPITIDYTVTPAHTCKTLCRFLNTLPYLHVLVMQCIGVTTLRQKEAIDSSWFFDFWFLIDASHVIFVRSGLAHSDNTQQTHQ